MKFSPDSRLLAIAADEKIVLLDIATGKSRQLCTGDKSIRSLVWLSDRELAYAGICFSGSDAQKVTGLNVFRREIDEVSPQRVEVYQEDIKEWFPEFPTVFWSPNGRYAILCAGFDYQPTLLDVTTGTAHRFGSKGGLHLRVAWKPDSSAALFAQQLRPYPSLLEKMFLGRQGPKFEVFFIEPRSGKISMIPERISSPKDCLGWHHLDPAWTANGQYVVLTESHTLIRPEPWEVISLKRKVLEYFCSNQGDLRPNMIHPLPVPGWLWVDTMWGSKVFAFDYKAETFVFLTEAEHWIVTPDGRRICEVDKSGKIKIRDLKLPEMKATTQPTSKPAP